MCAFYNFAVDSLSWVFFLLVLKEFPQFLFLVNLNKSTASSMKFQALLVISARKFSHLGAFMGFLVLPCAS